VKEYIYVNKKSIYNVLFYNYLIKIGILGPVKELVLSYLIQSDDLYKKQFNIINDLI
jgi:hypothetical protein